MLNDAAYWTGRDDDDYWGWDSMVQTCHKHRLLPSGSGIAHEHFITIAASKEEALICAEVAFRGKMNLMGIQWK